MFHCKLGDLATIKSGKSNRQDATEDGPYCFFDRSMTAKRSNRYLFDCKAIIVPGEGKDFFPRYFEGKFDLHQRCYFLSSLDESVASTKYLYYYLTYNHSYFARVAVGSTVPSLRLNSFEDMPVNLHSPAEQQHIVGVIRSVDDLIEKESEIIKKLDGFAQRLYSSAIENHQEKTYRLTDCCDFIPGYSYTGSELQDSEIGMVSIKSFERTGGFKLDGVKALLPNKSIINKRCDIGDVLVAHTDLTKNQEIIGSPVIVTTKGGFKELTFSMDLVKVDSKVEWLNNAVLYRVLNSSLFKKHALGFCTGTTVVHLSRKALETYQFEGPVSIDKGLAKRLEDIQKTIAYKTKKIEELESAKSKLLIKYFGSN